jgi:Protein kinase domain
MSVGSDGSVGCPGGDTLGAFIAGALAEVERAAIANHAAWCASCHALIEDLVPTAGNRTGVPTVASGARVGRYVIGERLGAGGMGVVHAALDSELQRRVAVKLLRPDRHGRVHGDGRDRLMREARTLARLAHPNVVTVFDVGAHDGQWFIAMELVDGGSLGAWLRRAPRTTDEIIDRMIEAGRGLAAAHAAGVVHRDVKPDNILVGLESGARMTDFGLAQLTGAPPLLRNAEEPDASATPTRTSTLVGTPAYMAPEHLTRGVTNALTDQWSFCATLYEVLAGVRPFAIEDAAARQSAIAAGQLTAPAPGRRVPGWVRHLVLRGLCTDPHARWPSMDAVVRQLVRGRQRRRTAMISGALAIAGVAVAASLVGRAPASAEQHTGMPRRAAIRSAGPAGDWVDDRPGCHCPYSACSGGCVSVCSASAYTSGQPLPGISVRGRQEVLLGASSDGDTILYLAGRSCKANRLMLARRRGATFESVDLTDQLDRSRVDVFESCCTLSADGRTAVLAAADHRGLVRARIEGFRVLAPDDAEFRALTADAPSTVHYPVLAADELTLYYRLDSPDSESIAGRRNGSYAAARGDRKSAFLPGILMPRKVQQYEYITGVSQDGLSLFMSSDYETIVLVRAHATEPFGEPAPHRSPARLGGWRAIPLAGCQRILTTGTPGGCENEDIVTLYPLPLATAPPR